MVLDHSQAVSERCFAGRLRLFVRVVRTVEYDSRWNCDD